MTMYTVQKGDSLWAIAKKFLGNGALYPRIMEANELKDTALKVGQKLKIPSKVTYADIGKAFEKAMNDIDNLPSVQKLCEMIGE